LFTEARANKQHVTLQTLQQWGIATSFQFTSPGLSFKASARWVQDFKKKHKIRQRHMKNYINSKDNAAFEETVTATDLFQKQIVNIIPNYNLNNITKH
jgi:hypothetical protein